MFLYYTYSCFDAEKLMFALKYAMTQLKCCKKDKVGKAIKEVLVIEEVRMFDSVTSRSINFWISYC